MDTGADRFFDVETGGPVQLRLQQRGTRFRVLRQIGYRDPGHDEPFVVPADTATFETDLTSVPWFFAWLVPRLGTHLPAAVLHDGLVSDGHEGRTYLGPHVDHLAANRILRDAMGHLGTPRIRRWTVWAAVTVATAFTSLRPRWRWLPVVLATVVPVVVLGVVATLDLVDVWDALPWMGARPWHVELGLGGLLALVIPLGLSSLWGALWPAGAIAGVMLALLLHVTLMVVTVYGLYRVAESVVSARERTPTGRGPHNPDAVPTTGDGGR